MSLFLSEFKKIFPLFLLLFVLGTYVSCRKKTVNENQENQAEEVIIEDENSEEKKLEALFDFYSPAFDKGEWVEELLARLEEERIAQELASMEESLSEYQSEDELSEDVEEENLETEEDIAEEPELSEIEKFFSEEKSGTVIHGKNNVLKFYEFENEVFSPQYSDGKLINVHSSGNSVDRYFYDENYHLVKKEYWNIPSAQGAVLEKTEEMEYYPDSSVVSKKSITTKDSIENLTYSRAAKILTSEKYAVLEKSNQKLSSRKFLYNKDDQLISDELTEYFYKDKEYQELDYSFTKKYDYTFNEGDIPPDFKYYENGVLKMLNKYSVIKGTYVSEIFFDKNFTVKTYYENNVRVKDVFYNDGKVTREKLYGQEEKIEK